MVGVYLSIFVIIIFLVLGVLVLLRGINKKQNFIFFAFILSSAFWTFSNLMVDISTNIPMALTWAKLTIVGPILLPIFLFYFTLIFPDDLLKKNKFFLVIPFIIISCFLLFYVPTEYNIVKIKLIEAEVPIVESGTLYNYFSIYFIFLMLLSIGNLLRSHFIYKGYKKIQLRYILLGIVITFFLGITTNLILLQFNISQYANLGPYFNLIFIGFTFYAILKYRLMDIRFVISRSILYFILILSVALSFTFITFSTAQFFQGQGQIWITILVSLIIVTGLDPLKRFLAKISDKFFYKGKIEYQEVLRDVGQVIATELDLQKLIASVQSQLEQKLKIKDARVLTLKKNGSNILIYKGLSSISSIELAKDNFIINYLNNHRELIITEEIGRKKSDLKDQTHVKELELVEKELDAMGVGLTVPIFLEDKLVGLFLVKGKLSGSPFTQEDLNFFEILAPQVANALEKSKLFEEVQAAKANLEILVDKRTADLKERNQYLTAIQQLINIITRSLDFQKVMQIIADGIHKELGFIGGILSFINEEEQSVRVGAISQSPIVARAINLLPKHPGDYFISLNNLDNDGVRAIREQQIIYSDSFYKVVGPALPKLLCDTIQKMLGMRSLISVPVYSEEKVIGVINFALKKDQPDITEVEKEMMKTLADQVGIVYRNLTLYNRIQEANEDLKVANARLKNLDQAKSEFLSIASHQLRTPLTGIKGYLSMIIDGDFGDIPVKIKKVLEDVFENSDRLTRLVNIFLNVSRIESGRFEITKKPADLSLLIEECIKELMLSAEKKNLKLKFHKPKKVLADIPIDRDKIKDVLINLLDNAIKYTPEGKVEIFVEVTGQALQVIIKDTGIGIKKGEDKELFKKFVRGEGIAQINTSGSGLGLFIAKKIVEGHGGKVWAESEGKDMGSKFIFTLPME